MTDNQQTQNEIKETVEIQGCGCGHCMCGRFNSENEIEVESEITE